jgi:hypothetical protein
MAMLKVVANEPGLRDTVSTAAAVSRRKTRGVRSEEQRTGGGLKEYQSARQIRMVKIGYTTL